MDVRAICVVSLELRFCSIHAKGVSRRSRGQFSKDKTPFPEEKMFLESEGDFQRRVA
jgi:hypothetical protein